MRHANTTNPTSHLHHKFNRAKPDKSSQYHELRCVIESSRTQWVIYITNSAGHLNITNPMGHLHHTTNPTSHLHHKLNRASTNKLLMVVPRIILNITNSDASSIYHELNESCKGHKLNRASKYRVAKTHTMPYFYMFCKRAL
jgi:hypothetical protein